MIDFCICGVRNDEVCCIVEFDGVNVNFGGIVGCGE